eukprot:s9922_g1.t1
MAASSRRKSQMQLGALQYPRYPMASDAEHFHFLEILAGTYDSTINNMRIADNLWNNNQFICAFPVERVPKHPLSGISTRSGDLARFSFKNMQADRVQRIYIHLLSVLDDGETPPPVIELQGISAGQLSLVLTQYTPLETTTQNTADIGTNAAAIAALQGQVAALPAAPDLTPYALAADLAAAEGSILANASGLVAVNTSLTQGLASKANQSALEAFQAEVNGKSTPDSVDLKLANHPTTAAMNSSITSANNATLATVAATYALKSVVEQLSLDVAARQTAGDVSQFVATALLPMASTKELNAAVALRTTPLDVDTKIANALLQYATYDAGQALQDSRLDGHDAAILALQNAGPFATSGDLTSLQVSLQSAIDGLLAEIATLGGATNLVNAPAWPGNAKDYTDAQLLNYSDTAATNQLILDALVQAAITAALVPVTLSNGQSWGGGPTFNLLKGSNVLRNLSVAGALTATFQNLDDTILIESDSYARSETYTQLETGAVITAALDVLNLSQYRTEAQVLALIAGELVPYWDQSEVSSFVAGELTNYQTSSEVDNKIITALLDFYMRAEADQAIANAVSAGTDLSAYYTSAETQSYVANELLAYYPRTELDSLLTATLTQYW